MNQASPMKGLLISNGIEGLRSLFQDNAYVQFDVVQTGKDFQLDLAGYDLLLAPNGTDHVALYRAREAVHAFLQRGGTLLCFDGWFTDWVPGNRWVMDNTKKSIDMRYLPGEDPYSWHSQFSLEDLNYSHGISGWWSCGYIEPAPGAHVLIQDTWGRALMVLDEQSTSGRIVLTASGPLADASYATTDDPAPYKAMSDLYLTILKWAHQQRIPA